MAAGVMDLLHLEPLFGITIHLGYPPYFSTILGTWKILGGLALLVQVGHQVGGRQLVQAGWAVHVALPASSPMARSS